MTAVQSGNLEAIKLLVTCNANINAQNSYHGKLLFKGKLVRVGFNKDKVLNLGLGFPINFSRYSRTRVSEHKTEVWFWFPWSSNLNGQSPTQTHFFGFKKPWFKCHLATPLMLAIADGKLSIIQYLLKNGADTEIQDYRKQKAADWAEERGNHEALSYITKHDQEKRKFWVALVKKFQKLSEGFYNI